MIVIDDDDDEINKDENKVDKRESDNDSEKNKSVNNDKINILDSISRVITATITSTVTSIGSTESSKTSLPNLVNSSKKLEDVISKLTSRVGKETISELIENSNDKESSSLSSADDEPSDSAINSGANALLDIDVVKEDDNKDSKEICNNDNSSLVPDSSPSDDSPTKNSGLPQICINSKILIEDTKSEDRGEGTKENLPTSLVDTLQNTTDSEQCIDDVCKMPQISSIDKDKDCCNETDSQNNEQQETEIISSSSAMTSDKDIEKQNKMKRKRSSRNINTYNTDDKKKNENLLAKTCSSPLLKNQNDTSDSSDNTYTLKTRRSRNRHSPHSPRSSPLSSPQQPQPSPSIKSNNKNLVIDTFIPTIPLPPRRHE